MKNSQLPWIIVGVLVLFWLLSGFGMMGFGGMMGPGMMGRWYGGGFFMNWPFLILLIGAIVLLIYCLGREKQTAVSERQSTAGEASSTCPGCGRAVQADWNVCPYCRSELNRTG